MNITKGLNLRRRVFSILACVLLLTSTFMVGFSLIMPNAEAAQVDHDNSNLQLRYLSDYGRIVQTINWNGIQTVRDPMGFGFTGLVIDHSGYDHTPGLEDIADSYNTSFPYAKADDLKAVLAITRSDSGTTQKSVASFRNEGTIDPYDILINQTAWTVNGKDWAIIQWDVSNIKSPVADITNFNLGYEIGFSQNGSRYGIGGNISDGGDDIDGYDGTYDTYWVKDSDKGVVMGVASAITTDPINHYYGEDLHVSYDTYKTLFGDDTWLYNRQQAGNALATDGVTPGNVTTTVGWNGETILAGESRTFTLVIAMNYTHNDMIAAIQDAQFYYNNLLTGYILTEIKDEGLGSAQIEVYNIGRPAVDPSTILSLEADGVPLTGTWSNNPIKTYGYSTFTVTGGSVDPEGATITLFEGSVQIDSVSYGTKGIAPDPLDTQSTARKFDTGSLSYSDLWLHGFTPTWDAENNVGGEASFVWVALNSVMFNPIDIQEGYVELMFRQPGSRDISGWKIVGDEVYTIPGGTILTAADPYFVLPYSLLSSFFTEMTPGGDNVYLYDASGNLVDMVGWTSMHTKGKFMQRSPEGQGDWRGYDDATSALAGWTWDHDPFMILTEFYADSTSADIEVYNPRGGDKVPTLWTLDVDVGALTGSWSNTPIPAGGYSTFTISGGTPGEEGDTITFYYNGTIMDTVSYGTSGIAPDPLSGESTSRYYNTTGLYYHNEWTREDTPTWDAQNDVPALNLSSYIILDEIMFNPSVDPNGRYFVLINRDLTWQITDQFVLVSDSEYQLPSIPMNPNSRVIVRYDDVSPGADNFFQDTTASGDNVYLYDSSGRLLDMVGWDTAHTQGMCARRDPHGFGTQDGYDDISSTAAGWVFNSPLEVLITEISDSDSIANQLEVYNFWYPQIDFSVGFEFRDSTGNPLPGSWSTPIADAGQYAVFDVTTGLDTDGDDIGLYQSGILADNGNYGTRGIVPDPLPNESTQRFWNASFSQYWDIWGRNWTTGTNFGFVNDIPEPYDNPLVLNEVLFNPATPGDRFVELYLRWGNLNISGYKIVGDVEYVVPDGTWLTVEDRYYYFTEAMDSIGFFTALDVNGDNVYLYDDNGTFLDEVGWSSSHIQGQSMCRVPNGNGTSTGYDDTSSYLAGWRFGCTPTISLVRISMPKLEDEIKYGTFMGTIIYNVTITNKQAVVDTFDLSITTLNGYPVVIMDETMSFIVTDVTLLPDEIINLTIIVTLPSVIPFIAWDNLTFAAQSQTGALFRDELMLGAYVSPFIWPEKWATPSQIYVDGTGHDEIATIYLNLTGMGSVVELIQPQDVVFCVDTSGSMSPEAINIIKEGLSGYVDEMAVPDQGCVITFGGMVQKMHDLTDDYVQLQNDIAAIPMPSGGTMMVGALTEAINELNTTTGNGNPDHIQVIILLTDGQPTDGTPAQVRALAQEAADNGIMIFTIGLEPASGFLDEQLLMDVADITGGMYFYAPTAQELPGIYKLIAAYIGDIAGRDPQPFDGIPMVRDVLPPWIVIEPGSFTLPPETNYVNATGYRILEWNITSLGIGASWEVSFNVRSLDIGWLRTNDLETSRVYFVDYFDVTNYFLFPEVLIEVLPSAPIPPKLWITEGSTADHIMLYWDIPASPGTVRYLIYNSDTPTGFDFSSPWIDTSINSDNGLDAVRLSWNHTNVANVGHADYREQQYYCIRAVNNLGEVSYTSRTVGKWTKSLPGGVSTFSIPLEPLIDMYTHDYTVGMNANYIKYIESGDWVQHDMAHGTGFRNILMEVGKGYEVQLPGATDYTFFGMPGAHIHYLEDTFGGFDSTNGDDISLTASVNPTNGNVMFTWNRPSSPGMGPGDEYVLFRSSTRDGFDSGSATEVASISWGTENTIDTDGIAQPGTQWYYMIIPRNSSGTGNLGRSTYSIGVFIVDLEIGYDTLGIPLQSGTVQSLDWYCSQFTNVSGINYHINSDARWSWHSTMMPAGAFDPDMIMTDGYQVSTFNPGRYVFIGR